MSDPTVRKIGFADSYGTRAEVTYDPDSPGDDQISLEVSAGFCSGQGFPTPEAARQLAAALLDAADRTGPPPSSKGSER